MEIRQYLLLLKKWTWLLIPGMVLGGIAAYVFSMYQPVVYQTRTRIMIGQASNQDNLYQYNYNMSMMVATYGQLINTEPVLDKLNERLGYTVDSGQIGVKEVPNSVLLEVTVSDGDPNRAAEIANNLVEIFAQYNTEQQAVQYQASEDSLKAQITQVEALIASLQDQITNSSETNQELQKQKQEKLLVDLKEQLDKAVAETIQTEGELAAFFPIPMPTSTPIRSWMATATPVPTPTLSPAAMVDYKETQNRLEQQIALRDLYRDTYNRLLVAGDPEEESTLSPSRQDQLQANLMLYNQIYATLVSNYENVRLARLRSTPNVTQVEPALVPAGPVEPQPLRNGMLGAVTGLFIMGGLAFLVEYLDDTLKTPDDVEQHLQLSVLGMIGEMKQDKGKKQNTQVFVINHPMSPVSEAFRTLRTNLKYMDHDKPLKSLLVTSANPSEGKTTVAVNLAAVMAQSHQRAVLIDTDLRRPKIHKLLGIENRIGLGEVFKEHLSLAKLLIPWGNPPFGVITSGGLPPNPSELLGSKMMEQILAQLKRISDIVILDSSPCFIADPFSVAPMVDGVLLIIEPGKTKIEVAKGLVEQLRQVGANIVGVVLNPITRQQAQYYTKYNYYYSSYYSKDGYRHYFNDNGKANHRHRSKKLKEVEKAVEMPEDQKIGNKMD